jgi:uncharacterized repeat protein (TIGR02059 family)
VTLTLSSAVSFGESVTVSYTPPASGNQLRAAASPYANVEAITEAPVVVPGNTQNVTPPKPTKATINEGSLVITFDGALQPTAGDGNVRFTPDASQFTVMVDGSEVEVVDADTEPPTGADDGVTVADSMVTLTLVDPDTDTADDNEAVSAGDAVTVSYSHVATDQFGHPRPSQSRLLVAASPNPERSETVNPISSMRVINNTPPRVESATINAGTLTVTFDAVLTGAASAHATDPGVAGFTVSGATIVDPDGEDDPALPADNPHDGNGVRLAGNSVVFNVTPVTAAATVTVDYSPGDPALRSAAAEADQGAVATFSGQAVTNTTPPVLSTLAATDGSSDVTVTSDATLDTLNSTVSGYTGQFTVTVAGAARTVDRVAVTDTTVTLTLAGTAPATDEEVTVTYTAGHADYRLTTPAGVEVADITDALTVTV